MKLALSFLLIYILSEIHGEEEEKFVCAKPGRYENPTDETCNSFYLCSYSLKGELIQTQYSCPEKSIFSPSTATCSKNYTCPRVSRSIRDLVQIEAINNIHYHCKEERIDYYECRRSGRYADLVGTTCKKYYLCSLLESGTYVKTLFECPEGSFFNPRTQKCHVNYECPCHQKLNQNNWISSGHSSRQEERHEEIGWAERLEWTELFKRWTEHYRWTEIPQRRSTREPTEASTLRVSTESCIDKDDAKPFVCKEEGKFPDRKDVTCTDYYFCSKLLNGGFVKTKLSCTYGSTFNPYLKKCSMRYECPCQFDTVSTYQTIRSTAPTNYETFTSTERVHTTEPSPTPLDCQIPNTEFICTRKGRYPDRRDSSCNTYFHCENNKNGKLIRKRYRCPRCLTFNPSTEKCTDNYICPCSFTEAPGKTSKATTNTPSKEPNTGKTSSSKTKSTTTSKSHTTGSTSRTPENSISTTERSGSSTTRNGTRTTNDCIIPPTTKTFKCSTKGRFANKWDLTCTSYFLCSALSNGTLLKTKYICPKNSAFDPSLRRCSNLYECPCANTPVTTSKLSSSTTSRTTAKSSSTSSGTPSDSTEKTEITADNTKTSEHPSSTLKPTRKTHTPPSSVSTEGIPTSSSGLTESTGKSSSSGGSSSTSHTGKTQKTSSKSPSTGGSTSRKPDGSKSTTEKTGSSSTSSGSKTTNDCITPPSTKPFKCSRKGRFPNKRDLTCTTYFLCSALNNGTLIKTQYRCPRNSAFDPSLRRCSNLYECPCANTPVTTPKLSSSTTSRSTGKSSSTSSGTPSDSTENTEITEDNTKTSRRTSSTLKPTRKTQTPPSSVSTERISTSSSGLTESTGKSSSPGGSSSTSHTDKTQKTSSKSPSTGGSTSRKPDGFKSTTEKTGSSSTSSETKTTNDCIIPPSNKPFKCSRKGRFPNKRDLTCTTYFLCSALNNGTLLKTQYRCPRNSAFDPSLRRCSNLYECPCANTPVTTAKLSSSTTSRTTGKSSSTSSGTPSDSTENTEITEVNTKTSQRTSSTPKPTRKTQTPPSSVSTERISTSSSGLTESTGKSSSPGGSSSTSHTDKTQKTSSKSPSTGGSTSRKPDGSKSTTEKTGSLSTSSETKTTNDCIIPPFNKPFKCSRKGRFPNKRDLTCTTYFLCSTLNNGTLLKTQYRCPRNSAFDPSLRRCSNLYECPCANTPVTTPKLSSSTTSRSTGKSSSTSSGTPSDSTENTEITEENTKTSRRTSSTLKPTRKTQTPPSSVSTERISTSSSGLTESTGKSSSPGGSSSTSHTDKTQKTSSKSPSTGGSTSRKPDGSKSTTEKTGSSSTSSETKTTNDCIIPPFNKPFKCSRKGRFPNKRDLTCTTYFLCSTLNNGTLLKTQYRCPRNSAFDPSLRRCSNLYECPCANTPVTTAKLSSSTTSRTTGKSSPTSSGTPSDSTENTEITEENTKTSRRTSSTLKPTRKTQTPPSSVSTERISTSSSGLTESTGKSSSPGGSSSTSHTDKTQKTSSKSPSTGGSTSRKPDGSKSTTEKTGSSSTSSETKTTNDCIIPPFNKPFKCSRKGRFPNKRDLTCTTYFLCSTLNNGTLLKTQYRCPRNSAFDPSLRRCSNLYECPCANTPVTTAKLSSSTTSRTTRKSSSTSSGTPSDSTENTEITEENTKTSRRTSSTLKPTRKTQTPPSSVSTERISTSSSGLTESTGKSSSPGGSSSTSHTDKTQKTSSKSPSTGGSTSRKPDGSKSTTEKTGSSSTSSETKTTNDCIIPPSNKPFKCSRKGRFPNKRDLTCTTYFLCSALNNGTLLKTQYICPRNSAFDPSLRRCSNLYECPCANTPVTTPKLSSSTTSRTTGKSSSTSSGTPSDSTENTEITEENTKTSRRTSSTLKPTRKTQTPPSSVSTERISTSSSGLTEPTGKSSSPGDSSSTSHTDKTQKTSSKSPSTGGSTSRKPDGSKSTTEKTGSSSTSSETKTTSDCIIPPSNKPFRCSRKGRFPNKRDLTCTTYFLCSALNNGTLLKTQYRCPRNSAFDPSLRRCSNLYECPCANTPVTTPKLSSSTTSRTTGKSSSTSSGTPSDSTENTEITEENTKTSRRTSSTLKPTRKTQTPPSSVSTERISTSSSGLTEPTGKSSSPGDSSSTSHTDKTQKTSSKSPSTGESTSRKPDGSKSTTEKTGSSSTSSETKTTNDCIIPPSNKPFRCSRKGRFPNKRDLTCTTYFLCSALNNGTLLKTQYRCPRNSAFDPSLRRCSNLYECPCANTPITTPKLSSPTTSRTTGKSSSTSSGTPSDSTENTEITEENTKTSRRTSSTLKPTRKTQTPPSSVSTERISTSSSGLTESTGKSSSPGGSSSTSHTDKTQKTSSKTPSTGGSTSRKPDGSKSTTEKTGSSSTSSETKTTNDCIIPPSNKPFKCSRKGRFPNKRDLTCTTYFLCSALNNGTLLKTQYRCPRNSAFDPSLRRCSNLYECPCANTPVTTPKLSSSTTSRTTGKSSSTSSGTPSDSTENTEITEENTKTSRRTSSTLKPTRKTQTPPSSVSTERISTSSSGLTESTGKSSSPGDSSSTSHTDKTQKTSSKSPSTGGSTSRKPDGSKSTTEKTGSSSTSSETKTTNDCIIPPSNKPFRCSRKGRFPNKRDLTCTTYFLCSALNNGTLLKTQYRCPRNSAFDPSLRRCSNLYECPCANTPITTPKLSSSTTSRTTGKSSSTSSGTPSDSTENTEITEENTKTSRRTSSTLKPTRKTQTPPSSVSTERISTSSSGLTESTGKSSSPGGSSSTSHTDKTQKTSSKTPSTGGSTSRKPDGSKSTTEKTGSSSTSSETKTTNDCIIPPSNKPFRCSSKGRFPNKRDLTCTTYFLCSALNNGTLLKTQYRCPRNSAFDPSLRRCSNLYECPCANTPVTTPKLSSSTTSRTTGKSSSTSSGTPSDSTENTEITEENTKTSRRTSSTLKPTRKTQTPPSSVSTERISTSSSGLTESTGNTSSPGGSSSTSHTDKTQKTSSKSPSTGGSTSRKPDGSKSTTEKTGSSSTSSETKTTNDCIIPPFNKPFKCSRKGRFPNKRDLTCTSYFLCSALNNGTLLKTQYRCPRNSAFDPSLRRCSNLYECPCAHIPSMSPIYSSTTTSRTSGNSTSSKSVAPSSTTTESSQAVSSTARSTEKSYTSTSTHSSSENSEPTHSTCIDPPSTYKFICETRGRFADIRDRSCSYYFLCSLLPDGTIVQARYRCNKGLKFNPIKQNCSPFYDCPCDIITTSPTTSRSSTVSTVLPDICQPVREEFVCTSVGRFPKPGDVSCCTYYSCTKSSNGTIAQTEFSCPEGSSFDPVFRVCSDSYQCPCHVTESPEYLSTSSDDCVVPTEEFICTSPGRFPNRQDVSCCNYFLCNDAGNGTFAKIEYNCPMGKSFDPELKRCSSSYVCPCRITENPLSSTIERTSPTTTSPAVVTNRTTDFTQPPECDISPSNPEHVCTQRGRFRDNKDITCSNYFLCSRLRSGLFIRTQYSCPRFSFFNPLIGLCTTSYKCPCINTFSTPSRSTGRITKIPGTRAPWHINTKKTTPATTPRQCIPLNPSIGEFVCSEQGKFLNPFDTKCTSYVHCLRKNSVLVKTVVNCEGMTAFDVKLQKCTKNAICEVCK